MESRCRFSMLNTSYSSCVYLKEVFVTDQCYKELGIVICHLCTEKQKQNIVNYRLTSQHVHLSIISVNQGHMIVEEGRFYAPATVVYRYTRKNPEMNYAIKPLLNLDEQIALIDFCSNRQITVFIVHGFFASGQSAWMKEMADAYISRRDANVFIVDWGKGANHANYLQVAANIRVVAAIVARFLKYLIEVKNLDPCNTHLIGHSLGAHTCGYIGKLVLGIERLTALDAAQIGFEGYPSEVRLDPDDATFIDSHHTNAKPTVPFFGLGFMSEIGDIDFYINGGLAQPNCVVQYLNITQFTSPLQIATLPVDVIGTSISCSHSKSTEYFIEAIRNPHCIFWGHKTGILKPLLNSLTMGRLNTMFYNITENCNLEECVPMGLETFAYPARGRFAVETAVDEPFCYPDDVTARNMEKALYDYYDGEENILTPSEDCDS